MDFGAIQGAQPLRQMVVLGAAAFEMAAANRPGGAFGFGNDGFHGSPELGQRERGGMLPSMFMGSMFGGGAGGMIPQMGFDQQSNPMAGLLQMMFQMNPMLGQMMGRLLQGFMGFGNPLCMGGMGGMGGGQMGGFPGGQMGGFPGGQMGGFAGAGPVGAFAGIGPNGPFAGVFNGAPGYQMPPAAFAPPAYAGGGGAGHNFGGGGAAPVAQTPAQPAAGQRGDRTADINQMLTRGGKGITDQQRQQLMKDLDGVPTNVLDAINRDGISLQIMQHGETPDDYKQADGKGLVTVGEFDKDTKTIRLSADWLGKQGLGKTSITKHEFGHAYQQAVGDLDPARARTLNANDDTAFQADTNAGQLPTEYADGSSHEYFAETFAKGLDGGQLNANQSSVLNQFLGEANRL